MTRRAAVALLFTALAPAAAAASDIALTRHNLSVSGPGTVKALVEDRICVFCHTPHNADSAAPLWNRSASGAVYTPYSSTSMNAAPGAPTGSSKLCLSCHDGTIALGEVLSEGTPIAMNGVTTLPPGPTNLGSDLHDDHPISFPFTGALAAADGELVDPSALTGAVRLDAGGELQCTTCHDPHDDTFGDFLVEDNTASALCRECHDPSLWSTSIHATSMASWNGSEPDPWPHTAQTSVGANGCESCHNPHGAADPERLFNQQPEEVTCLVCHNGNVHSVDLEAEFSKFSVHPITSTSGVHDAEEAAVVNDRHVECADCHEAHSVTASGATAPDLTGTQGAARGVDTDGAEVAPASYQYETCYRCHADNPGKPGPAQPRQLVQDNVRLEFDPGNPSFHPVEAAGPNPGVVSLLPPWTTSSVVYCTDCHTNDSGPRAGGSGPEGPHGSANPWLLGWRYDTADPNTESAAAYALCYRCHDRASILTNVTFSEHRLHITNERTSCSVCHDPHGISASQGDGINHSNLVNFDTSVVSPNSNGDLYFEDTGNYNGRCSLRCHGQNHINESY